MWGAVPHPLEPFLPSAWTVTAAEAVPPCCLQMPSDLARRMSLGFLNGPLICSVCHFLYWQAAAFPCTALHVVTSQDLTQSMCAYYSLSISCSNMTKQRLRLVIRAAQGMTCHGELLWYKAVRVECPFLPSLCLPLMLTLQKGKSLCFYVYLRFMSPAMEKPTKKWPGYCSTSQDSAPLQRKVSPAFHLPHCCEQCIRCQVKALLPFCTCGIHLKDSDSRHYGHAKAGQTFLQPLNMQQQNISSSTIALLHHLLRKLLPAKVATTMSIRVVRSSVVYGECLGGITAVNIKVQHSPWRCSWAAGFSDPDSDRKNGGFMPLKVAVISCTLDSIKPWHFLHWCS